MSLCGGRFVKGVEKKPTWRFRSDRSSEKNNLSKIEKQGAANVCSRIGVRENNGFGIITPICEL